MDLEAFQWEREEQTIREAEDISRERLKRAEEPLRPSERRGGRDFLRQTIVPLADAIAGEQQKVAESGAKLPTHGLPLLSLGELTLALVALRTIFNRLVARDHWEPASYADVAVAIGRACFWERRRRQAVACRTGERD